MKKVFLAGAALVALLLGSCGSKGQQQQYEMSEEIDSAAMMLINQNKTVFGLCGSESNDTTLQLITDSGDTLMLSMREALENEAIYGGYDSGDKMAVQLNEERTGVTMSISETMLHGDWVMMNPLDGSSEVGISIKEGGVAESIEQSVIDYKTWRIVDGQLEIMLVRDGGGDMEETNLYNIVKLDKDSLIYSNEFDLMEYARR